MGDLAGTAPTTELPQPLIHSQTAYQVTRIRQVQDSLGNECRRQGGAILGGASGAGAPGRQQPAQRQQGNDRSDQLHLRGQRADRWLQMREQILLGQMGELHYELAGVKLHMGLARWFLFGDNILP